MDGRFPLRGALCEVNPGTFSSASPLERGGHGSWSGMLVVEGFFGRLDQVTLNKTKDGRLTRQGKLNKLDAKLNKPYDDEAE